jgi:hypothetical protein
MTAFAVAVRSTLLVATLLAALGHAAAQPPAVPPPGQTPETLQAIKELKLQALEAESKKDNEAALKLYQRILRLDPDDALARSQSDVITKALEADRIKATEGTIADRDRKARDERFRQLINDAERSVLDAKTSGESEPLVRARRQLIEAKKYALAGDPDVDRIERQIVQMEGDKRVRLYVILGLVALVVLTPLVFLAIYLFRKDRVLEVSGGPQAGERFKLEKDSVSIGALEVDWIIADPLRKISRHHCDVIRDRRRYFLVDRSSNGTLLNGRLIERGQAVLLKRGDRIGLSDEITLRFG